MAGKLPKSIARDAHRGTSRCRSRETLLGGCLFMTMSYLTLRAFETVSNCNKQTKYLLMHSFINFFNTYYFRLYLVVLYCWYVHFRLYEYKIVRMLYCTNIYNILLCIEYISNWIHSLVWYYTSDSNDEDLLCCRLPSIAD